jgi:hypothetical protein
LIVTTAADISINDANIIDIILLMIIYLSVA